MGSLWPVWVSRSRTRKMFTLPMRSVTVAATKVIILPLFSRSSSSQMEARYNVFVFSFCSAINWGSGYFSGQSWRSKWSLELGVNVCLHNNWDPNSGFVPSEKAYSGSEPGKMDMFLVQIVLNVQSDKINQSVASAFVWVFIVVVAWAVIERVKFQFKCHLDFASSKIRKWCCPGF